MELPAAAVFDDVHEGAIEREWKARAIGRVLGIERHRARLQRVVVAIDEKLPHRRSDVAHAQPNIPRELAFEGEVVLVDVGALEVRIDTLVSEVSEVDGGRAQ